MTADLKAQLREGHERVFDGVLGAVAGLDADRWATPTGCPGWDVQDQLSHVIGVERLMLGDPADEGPLQEDLAHVRNDFGRVIEVAVAARRSRTPESLLEEARSTFERRLTAIDEMEVAALGEPLDGLAGLRMKGSQMLRTRLFDLVSHEQDIRRALGRPGGHEGPQVDIAVEQVLRAWARYLPPKHGERGVLGVAIAGRSAVRMAFADGVLHRDGAGPEPTATIHLEVPQLLAVAGGRTDAPDPRDLAITGDALWAVGVLDDASITP